MLSKNKKEKTRTVHLVLLSAYPLNSIPSTWACWAALNLQFKTVKHIKKKEHQQEKFTDTWYLYQKFWFSKQKQGEESSN